MSRRPQSVSWGLGVGEGGTGLTGKGDSVKEPLKRRVTCSTPNPGPVQGRECWGTRGTVLRSRLRIWTGCAAGAGGEGGHRCAGRGRQRPDPTSFECHGSDLMPQAEGSHSAL